MAFKVQIHKYINCNNAMQNIILTILVLFQFTIVHIIGSS